MRRRPDLPPSPGEPRFIFINPNDPSHKPAD